MVQVDAEVVITPLVDGLLSVLIPIVMLGVEMHQGGWVLESVCSERREQAGHSMFDDLVSRYGDVEGQGFAGDSGWNLKM